MLNSNLFCSFVICFFFPFFETFHSRSSKILRWKFDLVKDCKIVIIIFSGFIVSFYELEINWK